MTKIFKLAKFVGSDWVIRLHPTKKEAKVLKDKAIPLGIIYYIDEDFEKISVYYKVGSNTVEVQLQGLPRYRAEDLMECASDYYVHGYIDSGTIFQDEEVLIRTELLNYGLYTIEEDTSEDEEDTSEDCVDDLEEDTSEDCSSGLELCPHEEEDTSEDCVDGSELLTDEEDTSEDYSDILELCQHEEEDTEEDTEEDYSSGLELCPHEEDTSENCSDGAEEDTSEDCRDVLGVYLNKEETSKDYSKTINVYGTKIKNHCVSFSETMLVHEAVEQELIDFLGDLNLERWDLFGSDIDCTLYLNEQYNNMVTGFIMFGAVLRAFASDVEYSRDYYLGYMARSYNLRKWEIKELANLIDLGINIESSVIEPYSFTLRCCIKTFIRAVHSCICYESHRLLDYEQTVKKLQTEDWFDKAAKFYLTKVSWGKFKLSYIDDGHNIDDYDYFMAIKNYNIDLDLFEQDDMNMSEVIFRVAEDLNLGTEFIERYSSDGVIDIAMAIYILTKWYNQQNKRGIGLFNNGQTKLKILDHVVRKIKGVH